MTSSSDNSTSHQELRTTPKNAAHSSTPDIMNEVQSDENGFLLVSDVGCSGTVPTARGATSGDLPDTSTFSGGPPRRKAPPPPPKKLATLSTEDALSSSHLDMLKNEGSYETIPDVSKDPPAIPKRVALDVQGRPEEDDQLRPKPKPLPRVSSLQGAKGEVPPSVARMRQKHGKWRASGGDENRRQTVTVEYNPHAGSVDGLERITSCVSDEALASLELPPPPPPEDAMEDSEPLKFITRLGGHQPRPLSTCESLCSCSSTYGHVSNVDTIDDMCRGCCSCRSSTVTLLPENEDVEGSETDNISLRSETSFAVEMDNLVSMAELALSENSLELALKRNAAYLDPVGDLLMTSSSAKNRPLSSASLGDESTGGLLTPKAASPRYLSCTDIPDVSSRPDDVNIKEADAETLKVLFKSLLNQLDQVKHQLLVLGEGHWLCSQSTSQETQTDSENSTLSNHPTTADEKVRISSAGATYKTSTDNGKKETAYAAKEGVFTRKPKDTKQSPHSIRRYRRSRDFSNVSQTSNEANSAASKHVSHDSIRERNNFEIDDFHRAAYLNHVDNHPTSKTQLQNEHDEFHDSYEAFNNRNSSDSSNFDAEECDKEEDEDEEEEEEENYTLNGNLSLYVPEPSDHTCYISFGDNSPSCSPRTTTIGTVQSPGSSEVVTSLGKPLVSKLKSSLSSSTDCIANGSYKQSSKKSSAPGPPSNNMKKRSVSTAAIPKPQSEKESRNRTSSFGSDASVTPTNQESQSASKGSIPTTPEGFVPGAVKARRAMFETRSKQENSFDAFKLRKTASGSKEGVSGGGIFWGKSKIAKSASTSDLVITADQDDDVTVNQSKGGTSNTYTRPLKGKEGSSLQSNVPKKPERLSLLKGSNINLRQTDNSSSNSESELAHSHDQLLVSKMRTVFGKDTFGGNNDSKSSRNSLNKSHTAQDLNDSGCKSPEPRMNHLL